MTIRLKDGISIVKQTVIDDEQNITGNSVEAVNFVSTTTTSAPLVVNSTIKVDNLNAALLDGNDSNYFIQLVNAEATARQTESVSLRTLINENIPPQILGTDSTILVSDYNNGTGVVIDIDSVFKQRVLTLENELTAEISTRTSADISLQSNINNEITNRTNAILTEQTARIEADATLQLNLSNASNLSSGTVNTARLGTGTADSTTYLRGDSTWATVASGSLGDGQTWQDVKASRSSGTTYTNSTGKPIQLAIKAAYGNASGSASIIVVVNGTTVSSQSVALSASTIYNSSSWSLSAFAIVQPGQPYSVTYSGNLGTSWFELR